MLATPPVSPVTMPEDEPTVATVSGELLHMPSGVKSLRVIADPAHTDVEPYMAFGIGYTYIVFIA